MIKFGTILKPLGLKGEVRIFSDSDFLEDRLKKNQTFVLEDKTVLTVSKASIMDNVHKVKFKELNHIDEAEKLRGQDLYITELDHSLLEEDEYFLSDLVGLIVLVDNEIIGKVKALENMSAQPVLVIEEINGKTFMVPFVNAFVKEVNLQDKTIVLQLIEGLR